MNNTPLEFSGVDFSYSKAPFIKGLDLSLSPCALTGIIGPNGCGKSTLLKLGIGILSPKSGSIDVNGKSVNSLSSRSRAREISYMPQRPVLTSMSAKEFVLCGRYAHLHSLQSLQEEDLKKAEEAMKVTGALRFKDQSVVSLSGGQRQRCHLAMMLAQEASVMLLDEPLSALDIYAAHEMLSLTHTVAHEQSRTIAMVIQDLDLALRYCDNLVVVNNGAIQANDTAEAVLKSGVIEEVFKVDIEPITSSHGLSYSIFPSNA